MRRKSPPKIQVPSLMKSRSSKGVQASTAWVDNLLPSSIGKNATVDSTINRTPLGLVAVIGIVLFVGLFLQLLQLQVVEGDRMRGIAEGNRVREQVDIAPRGRILDRNGVVLADNTASFQLSANPYMLPESETGREKVYERVSELTGLEVSDIRKAAEEQGLDHPQPLLVLEHIDRDKAMQIEYELPSLSGFNLDAVPIREYVDDAALGHIIGYVGRVNEQDIADNPEIYPLDFTGKLGVEAAFDEMLRGQNGVTRTEIDALGRPLRTLQQIPTSPGQDMQLSIDYELQKRLRDSIAEQIEAAGAEKGAGVIMHADTGEVLASVSLPDYDNNLFAAGIGSSQYQSLLNDPNQPLLNRAMSEGYPTGSIIKPITLLGALDTNTVDEDTIIVDRGSLTLHNPYNPADSITFHGYVREGLGPMNARSAIARSSNIYFFTAAGGYENFEGMGINKLTHYYREFGLGSRTGIDIPQETAGLLPTPEWKQEVSGEGWFVGDTYNLAIGQGDLLASPLQMTRAYGAIINGGKLLRPQLRLGAEPQVLSRPDISSRNYRITQEGMRDTISSRGTTSPAVFDAVGVRVAGKSGTAETDPGRREAHAWFAAYAPYENPEVVSVVLIEEGFGGSSYAAPAIADSFEWYFRDR